MYRNDNSKKNIKKLLFEIEGHNGDKITNLLTVTFKRKNKFYKKPVYLFMSNKMIDNLNLKDNRKYFGDTTYFCVPPHFRGMKLFIMMVYNEQLKKTILCLFFLIHNENKETSKKY